MSDKMVFNGPASFDMQVMVINDETGQVGEVTVGLGLFEYPTPLAIKERIEKMVAEEFEGALDGFRLMTKEEAWKQKMLEKTGTRFAMMGGKDWDEI